MSEACETCNVICGHLCAMLCFETCCTCFVPEEVPFRPSDLTLTFIDYVLKRPSGKDNKPVLSDDQSVLSVEAQLFGTGDGLLSQMYRLSITYVVDSQIPKHQRLNITGTQILTKQCWTRYDCRKAFTTKCQSATYWFNTLSF